MCVWGGVGPERERVWGHTTTLIKGLNYSCLFGTLRALLSVNASLLVD